LEEIKKYSTLPKSIFQDLRLNGNDYRLYGYLKGVQGKEDYCFPLMNTIVSESGMSRTTIYNTLKRLSKLGWIEIRKRKGRSNLYFCKILPVSPVFGKISKGLNLNENKKKGKTLHLLDTENKKLKII
jgi:DNA-binding transcriptional ArsR family regulator